MFWADIMDICPYDRFSKHSDTYQHRVKIGTDDNWRWLTLPLEKSNEGALIKQIKLKKSLMKERWDILESVYRTYPLWEEYENDLFQMFFNYDYMWELNLRLILWVRDLLNLKTYISISWLAVGNNTTERIAYQLKDYGSVVYLAGKKSQEYLDIEEYEKLTKSKVALITYTPPEPFSTVSMLTPLLMYPPEKVLDTLQFTSKPEIFLDDIKITQP